MWLAIPLGPLIRILQAEVRGEVDNPSTGIQQLSRQGMGHAMRSGEEDHITCA